MNKSTFHIILKLLIASLLVGLALDFFGVRPMDIIHDIPETMRKIYNKIIQFVNWGGKYVLLGAIVVVPVWILMNLTTIRDKFRRKN